MIDNTLFETAETFKELRVHLDHLIIRQSIRYAHNELSTEETNYKHVEYDAKLRYDDIWRNERFSLYRKPEFQRETNAWKPDDCVEFLESVVSGRIIPSIILWRSPENSLTYVLDGAHRLSVLKAWMTDDWGDKNIKYYERRDTNLITASAHSVRKLVREQIGDFNSFRLAHDAYRKIADNGGAPKQEMSAKNYEQATFYGNVAVAGSGLVIQWETGDFDSAEQSFLRINRRGQALDPWEANLIEFRRGSYARCIMSIANGGESGHYWPKPNQEENTSKLDEVIGSFSDKARNIYKRLFVPPFKHPITDLNVPLLVAPAYFQPHKYLFEIIPLIVEQRIAVDEDYQLKLMRRDTNASAETVIQNAKQILDQLENGLEHLISATSNSKSLSIVPLFYCYNQRGGHARGLLYGFIFWLLSGKADEIDNRKLIFSANRARFEEVLFFLKPDIAAYHARIGAGLKSAKKLAEFYQFLMTELHNYPQTTTSDIIDTVAVYLGNPKTKKSSGKSSRLFSEPDKSTININEIFENTVRCHICGGIINLGESVQYDHKIDYAISKETNTDIGGPTHPFCNNRKILIGEIKNGTRSIQLPNLQDPDDRVEKTHNENIQSPTLRLPFPDFWGDDNFPQ